MRSRERFVHFLGDLWRVRRTGAKYDRKIVVHELDRTHEVNNSLSSRDPADKKQIRFLWIDAVAQECISCFESAIFLEIDSVVNYVNTFWIDIEQALDVALGFSRHSNDRVRHFERGFFDPD